MQRGLRIDVLGPVRALRGDHELGLGAPRQRSVLAALALRLGREVATGELAEVVWDGAPPVSADTTLQGYVLGLRKVLEPERDRRAAGEVIVRGRSGYTLRLAPEALDAEVFGAVVPAAHDQLQRWRRLDELGLVPVALGTELATLHGRLDDVVRRWRGTAYADLGDATAVQAERTRLEELRLLALEDRATLDVGLGRAAAAVTELTALTAAHPLRERPWAVLALALAATGRRGDGLAAIRQARLVLVEELGIEAGAELRAVQAALLRDDPPLPASRAGRPAGAAQTDAGAERPQPARPALVGRDQELSALTRLLTETWAAADRPGFAVLTGEPGIGKTRLAEALAERARAAGGRVLDARCPADGGAPALWPWAQVLARLDGELPVAATGEDAAARFRAWDQIVRAVLDRTADQPTLLLLDDLHWADASTLRVLSMLVAADRPARLVVVVTWRAIRTTGEPPGSPAAALLELAAALARRHALRFDLAGLPTHAAGALVRATTDTLADPARLGAVVDRAGGNPFFLVELARLLAGPDDPAHPAQDHSVDRLPAGVADVVAERVLALPGEAADLLRTAAVLGRDVDVDLLTRVLDDPAAGSREAVLTGLESAWAAGLLTELEVGRFRFAHDLVRESLSASSARSRRAGLHARAADALTTRGVAGHEGEVARHWLAAGPACAAQAWRSARLAARAARQVYGYDESASWLRAAVDRLGEDAGAGDGERCDLLVELADSLRMAGRWSDLRPVVHRALEVADRLDDTGRRFAAAVLPARGALWLATPYGTVDEVVVGTLRRVLAELPPGDGAERCRAMLSLASETYYAAAVAEREALVDEALRMARRSGDDDLVVHACLAGATTLWRSARSADQLALAEEAAAAAARTGDHEARVAALTTVASAANDLGLVERLPDDLDRARQAAGAQCQLFSLVVLGGLDIAWRALRGDGDGLARSHADLVRDAEPMAMAQLADSLVAVELMRLLWSGQEAALLELASAHAAEAAAPVAPLLTTLLCRTGRVDEAREQLAEHGMRMDVDDWLSPAIWSQAAEVALHLGDRALAAEAYTRLLPLTGRPATAGSGIIVGPVDAYLAMAATAVGETASAGRHAADAEAVSRRWQAPPVQAWVAGLRVRWGF